jgi:ATP-dependent Clp protease ATP-binding subunit ClpC
MILTSNIGARQLADFGAGVGFSTAAHKNNEQSNRASVIQTALKRAFSPEFLNRIDDVVLFNSLTREHIHIIIDIELEALSKRVESIGYGLEITDSAKDFIVDKGYDEKFGARPLKRAIQKHLEDPFAEEIINSSISEGDLLKADYVKDAKELTIVVIKGGILELPAGAVEALELTVEDSTDDAPLNEKEVKKKPAATKKKSTKSIKGKSPDKESND